MNYESQIEFDKIKELWANLAVTEASRDKIRNASFFLSESELRKQIKDTTNSRKLMECFGAPPLQNAEEIREILMISQTGDCLLPRQLEQAGTFLAAVRRLKDYLSRGKVNENPLAYYEENLDSLEELAGEISRQIRNESVDA